MFCGKCGMENPDGALFCSGCGEPLEQPAEAPGAKTPENRRHMVIGIAAVAAVALIVVAVLISLTGRSANSAAEKFAAALFRGDAETVVELVPRDLIEEYADEADISFKAAKNSIIDKLETSFGYISGMTGDIKVSVKASGSEEYSQSDRARIIESYDEMDVDVRNAKIVNAKITVSSGGEEFSSTVKIPVIKAGRSWYADILRIDTLTMSLVSAVLGF